MIYLKSQLRITILRYIFNRRYFYHKKEYVKQGGHSQWRHPEEGVIFPDQFIPVFGEKGKEFASSEFVCF